ncbi:MAG: hypothetical protein ACI4PF_03890, partial [Christensenellales bacterium]
PYFKRILVDGITEIYMKSGDTFRYELGLRNNYKKIVGTEEVYDDDGNLINETIYEAKLPDIFSDLYYTVKGGASLTGCQLYKYELVNGQKIENSPVITYAKDNYNQKRIVPSGTTTSWIIDSLDFKNFLNHNEVNLQDNISFSSLYFTLNKNLQEISYFGGSKYNGELAYFDREFTKSYTHDVSSTGSCEYDSVDEYMSFIYDLIVSKGSDSFAIKVTNEFLNVDWDNAEQSNVINFASITENVFTCLNTPVVLTYLNANKEDIYDEETTSGDMSVKYIKVTFEDTYNNYTILFDVENLVKDINDGNLNHNEYSSYIIYLTFSVVSKPTGV